MKKILALILTLCLLCTAAAGFADDTFTSEFFTVKLPEGDWQKEDGEGGITFYYKDGNKANGAIMFVVQDMDEETAAGVTEEMLPALYNKMITVMATDAADGNVAQEASTVAEHSGVLFSYKQEVEGGTIPVIGNTVYINGHLLALVYMNTSMSEKEIREKVLELSANVVYTGE